MSAVDSADDAITKVQDLYDGPDALPDALRDADREDTVCKICGVSYLVFTEVKALERRTKAAEDAMASWKDKIANVKELEEKLAAAEADRDRLDARVAQLQNQLYSAGEKQTEAVRAAEAEWADKLKAAKAAADADRQRAVDAAEARMETRLSQHSMAVRSMELQMTDYREALVKTQDVLRAQRRAASDTRDDLAKVFDDFAQCVSSCGSQLAPYLGSLTATHAALQAQVDDLSQKAQEVKPLRAMVDTLRRDVALAKEELEAQRRSTATAEADATALRGKVAELEALRGVISNQAEEKDSLRAATAALESQLVDSRAAVGRLTDELATATAAVAQHRTANTELTASVQALNTQLFDAKSATSAVQAELQQAQQNHAAAVARLTADADHVATTQSGVVAQLQTDLAAARAESDSAAGLLDEFQSQMMSMQQELAQHQANASALSAQLAEARAQVEAKTAEAQSAADTVLEVVTLRGQLSRERDRADNAVRQAEEMIRASSAMGGVEGMEKRLMALTEEGRSKDERIKHLELTVHQECTERTVLLDNLNALRKEAALPPLLPTDVHRMAQSYLASNHDAAPGPGPSLPPLSRRHSSQSVDGQQPPPRSARSVTTPHSADGKTGLRRTSSGNGPGRPPSGDPHDDGGEPASAAMMAWTSGRGRGGRSRGRGRSRPGGGGTRR